MAGKPQPNSESAQAARLTDKLGFEVSRKMLKCWIAKGYDLGNIASLKRSIKNQERQPPAMKQAKKLTAKKKKAEEAKPPEPPPLNPDDVEGELAKLQKDLLVAEDYDEARTIKTKISGVREVLKELREQKNYIRITDAIEAASMAAVASKAAWESLEDELPPQLEGLSAAQMKVKLRAFAQLKSRELSEIFSV